MKRKVCIIIIIATIMFTYLYIFTKANAPTSTNNNIEYRNKQDEVLQVGKKTVIITFGITLLLEVYWNFYGREQIKRLKYGGTVKEKNVEYCRELPKWMDLELAYASLYRCSNINKQKLRSWIIGAYLLKWSKDDNIIITDKGNKVFSIDLKDGNFEKTKYEQELYDILKYVARENNVIDNNEIEEWAKKYKGDLEYWNDKLINSPYNDNLRPETEALLGLKRFLLDYSLIEEKRHIEVKIWEEYLIYAELLGISKEVNKQFEEIYPNYSKLKQISIIYFDNIFAYNFAIGLYLFIALSVAVFAPIISVPIYFITHR